MVSTTSQLLSVLSFIFILLVSIIISMKSTPKDVVIFIFIAFIILTFYIFDINCTFDGGCNIWGFIKSALVGLALLSGIMTALYFIYKNKTLKSLKFK
jgi:hypothetical protein